MRSLGFFTLRLSAPVKTLPFAPNSPELRGMCHKLQIPENLRILPMDLSDGPKPVFFKPA